MKESFLQDFIRIASIKDITADEQANEAMAHLEAGKARYRIVLSNDLK